VKKCIIRSTASEWFVVESFLAHHSQVWRKMIDVKENEDGTFTISWDENDPEESIFNDWTEKDFTDAITNYINTLKESGVLDDDGEQKLTESIEQISEFFFEDYEDAYENYIQASYEVSPYYIDQTAEEVQQDIDTARQYIQSTNEETYGEQAIRKDEGDDRRPRLFF